MIQIEKDRGRCLLIVRMGGMLSAEEVKLFASEEQQAARVISARSGYFDLLVLTEGNFVQTQEVMSIFANLLVYSPNKARRIAVVRDGILTRMQARRVISLRSEVKLFETKLEALEWLSGGNITPTAVNQPEPHASV